LSTAAAPSVFICCVGNDIDLFFTHCPEPSFSASGDAKTLFD